MRKMDERLPDFGETYDPFKMRQMVEVLTRVMGNDPPRAVSLTVVNAATYAILPGNEIIMVDYTATAAAALKLPSASILANRTILVKDRGMNAAANNITVSSQGGEDVDGGASDVLASDGAARSYYSDGTNWWITASY